MFPFTFSFFFKTTKSAELTPDLWKDNDVSLQPIISKAIYADDITNCQNSFPPTFQNTTFTSHLYNSHLHNLTQNQAPTLSDPSSVKKQQSLSRSHGDYQANCRPESGHWSMCFLCFSIGRILIKSIPKYNTSHLRLFPTYKL